MNSNVEKAFILFNHFKEDFSISKDLLANSIFFYVPELLRMHREIWTEEALIILYPSDDSNDHGDCINKNQRGIYFEPYDEDRDYLPILKRRICWDFVKIMPDNVLPKYFSIDPGVFISE